MNWLDAIADCRQRGQSCVLVTIIAVHGSTPRPAASKMVVSEAGSDDSIGGGQLEYQAIAHARTLLAAGSGEPYRGTVTLGRDAEQCCGGQVELLYEPMWARPAVLLFGAGHVATALVKILAELACSVWWVDSRREVVAGQQSLPSNVMLEYMATPERAVERAVAGAYYLVMTHSHALDLQLVEAILARPDIRFCGLIGSRTKAAKFKHQLARKQFSETELARLVSPIGLAEIPGKRPMEIAVAVAAQFLREIGSVVTTR